MRQGFLYVVLSAMFACLTMCSTKSDKKSCLQPITTDSLDNTIEKSKDSIFTTELMRDSFLLDDLFAFGSEEALIKTFGKSNVTRVEEFSAEVEGSWWVSVLWAGTKNEVRFLWSDAQNFQTPNKIYHIASAEYKFVSDWKTTEGIRLGTTIPELEKLNNGPFSFYGFSWNFEGQVMWTNPERHAKGVYVSLRVPEKNRIPGIEGDIEILSDSDLAKKIDPVVAYIELRKNNDGH